METWKRGSPLTVSSFRCRYFADFALHVAASRIVAATTNAHPPTPNFLLQYLPTSFVLLAPALFTVKSSLNFILATSCLCVSDTHRMHLSVVEAGAGAGWPAAGGGVKS